ncbi:MAG TPA: hypothetical protein VK158_01905 [Acidobacteriota bacterium]|nr:hypothetical protein [Acidobacteriota bacterium]
MKAIRKKAELSSLETVGLALLVVLFIVIMVIIFQKNSKDPLKDSERLQEDIRRKAEECAKNPATCDLTGSESTTPTAPAPTSPSTK